MTDKERQMIEWYIPSPRDETLDLMEYYWKNDAGKIFKVYITDINPAKNDRTVYGCRYSHNGQRVHAFGEWESIGMNNLYDNKDDCRDDTHLMYEQWEYLRKIQEAENVY